MSFLASVIALLSLLPLAAHAAEDTTINTNDPIFWVKIVVIIILVILSGIVAGTDDPNCVPFFSTTLTNEII
jgi:hypothetical protein